MMGPMWNAWVKARKEGRLKGVTAEEQRQWRERMERERQQMTPEQLAERERRIKEYDERMKDVEDWGV